MLSCKMKPQNSVWGGGVVLFNAGTNHHWTSISILFTGNNNPLVHSINLLPWCTLTKHIHLADLEVSRAKNCGKILEPFSSAESNLWALLHYSCSSIPVSSRPQILAFPHIPLNNRAIRPGSHIISVIIKTFLLVSKEMVPASWGGYFS